jgi:hypothetical protein
MIVQQVSHKKLLVNECAVPVMAPIVINYISIISSRIVELSVEYSNSFPLYSRQLLKDIRIKQKNGRLNTSEII